jgi:O-succinylbenzoate synthase
VKVLAVDLVRVRLPFVEATVTSYGVETHREVALVRIVTAESEGWGEDVALPRPHYVAEYADASLDVLRHDLVPRLVEVADLTSADVREILAPVRGWNMAKAALCDAVLDAELRAAGRSLAQHLGLNRDRVPAGRVIGLHADVATTVEAALSAVAEGYRRLKIKIAPDRDHEVLTAVRRAVGDEIVLLADANAAYRREDASRLARLDSVGLAAIEQPLAIEDLSGHVNLARQIGIPIALDEPITSVAVALDALERGACTVMCVKPGRLGGILEARELVQQCERRDVATYCGGMYESGVGRRAAIAVAALEGMSIPGDLSASDRYVATDVTAPVRLVGSDLVVHQDPGIGPIPDSSTLADLGAVVEHLHR